MKKLFVLSILALGLLGCSSCKSTGPTPKTEEAVDEQVQMDEVQKDNQPDAAADEAKKDDAQADEKADESDNKIEKVKKLDATDKAIKLEFERVNIDMHYPEFGVSAMDTALEKIARDSAKSEEIRLKAMAAETNMEGAAFDKFEAGMTYEVIRAQSDAADVLLTHTDYTGGAHGGASIQTVMLDRDGNQIDPWSLFKDPDAELSKMSEMARTKLREQLTDYEGIDDMIRSGTEPKRENFSHMVRTDQGVRIYFEPYQVAPWAAGILFIDYEIK